MRVDAACAICLVRFGEPGDISALNCGHVYHLACIQESLRHKRECPTCRQPSTAKSIVKTLFFTNGCGSDASQLIGCEDLKNNQDEQSSEDLIEKLKDKVADLDVHLADEQRKSYDLQSQLDRKNDELSASNNAVKEAKRKQRKADNDVVALRQRLAIVENELEAKGDVEKKLKACRVRLKAVQAMEQLLNGPSDGVEGVCENMNLDAQSQAVVVALKRQYDEMRSQKCTLADRLAASQQESKRWKLQFDRLQKASRKLREELILTRSVKGANVGSPFDPALGRVLRDETCDSSSLLIGRGDNLNDSVSLTPGTMRQLVCGSGENLSRRQEPTPGPSNAYAVPVSAQSETTSPDMFSQPTNKHFGSVTPPTAGPIAAFCDTDDSTAGQNHDAAGNDVVVRLPGGFVCGGPVSTTSLPSSRPMPGSTASSGTGGYKRTAFAFRSNSQDHAKSGANLKRTASMAQSGANKRVKMVKNGQSGVKNVQRLSTFFARVGQKPSGENDVIKLD